MTNSKPLAEQWNIPDKPAPSQASSPQPDNGTFQPGPITDNEPIIMQEEKTQPDTMKRRGFFEAVRQNGCPQQHLSLLLQEHKQQAKDKLAEVDALAKKSIEHLEARIALCRQRIQDTTQKINLANQYREADDPDLQQLITEKNLEEQQLSALQNKLTDVRVKLGRAKSGIVTQSLEEAETQIRKALDIQQAVYDESRKLNVKKFNDERDNLAQLSAAYQQLYTRYEQRYTQVNKHLAVLDVDGISPITSKVLTNIGTISFGAAGFFFSTFAGYAGFGNQDILYFILGGLINSAKEPIGGFWKLVILLGLIILVTGVAFLCNLLIAWLKKNSEEEILSEVQISAQTAKKFKQLEYQASIKSNNLYAFWLQLIPGVLIAGLIVLSLAESATGRDIGAINASSEGLIIGTSIAISLAGLIYFYIIKIVEPRLIKRYNANPDVRINWIKSNWELVVILMIFIVSSICIIVIPYTIDRNAEIIPIDQRTRYAILLFIAICLVGSISFAYSVRYRGLIATNKHLERVMRWLNSVIAYCSTPEAPDVHNKISEEHGNIIHHVLKQLSFKTVINPAINVRNQGKAGKGKSFLSRLRELMKRSKKQEAPVIQEPVMIMTVMEPWEERYFPHIVDELKAVEFEYSEQRRKVQRLEGSILDYRVAKTTQRRQYENEIEQCHNNILLYETQIETELKGQSEWQQKIRNTYNKTVTDLLDGFHLGIWYRKNGLGPSSDYFDIPIPVAPAPAELTPSES